MRARVLDAAGNATASAPQTVEVANAAPAVTAVTSDDADGRVDAGDTLTAEMSEPLDPESVPAAGSLTLSRPSGATTTVDITGLTDGPVDIGTDAWVEEGASLTFSGSLALLDDGWRVRFAVEACESGCDAA